MSISLRYAPPKGGDRSEFSGKIFASSGLPQVNLEVFNAVFGPAGLAKDVHARLGLAFQRVMADPKVREQLEKQGYSILYQNSQQLAERVKRDLDAVRDAFKKAGLKQQS